MAKRFTSTDIWEEDWFLEMPSDYQLFWFYMLSKCDHAGFFKVNVKTFNLIKECKISGTKAVEYFNSGKDRVREVKDGFWFIEDFIQFQYGHYLNQNNRLHFSILERLEKFEVKLTSIRGLREGKNGTS